MINILKLDLVEIIHLAVCNNYVINSLILDQKWILPTIVFVMLLIFSIIALVTHWKNLAAYGNNKRSNKDGLVVTLFGIINLDKINRLYQINKCIIKLIWRWSFQNDVFYIQNSNWIFLIKYAIISLIYHDLDLYMDVTFVQSLYVISSEIVLIIIRKK